MKRSQKSHLTIWSTKCQQKTVLSRCQRAKRVCGNADHGVSRIYPKIHRHILEELDKLEPRNLKKLFWENIGFWWILEPKNPPVSQISFFVEVFELDSFLSCKLCIWSIAWFVQKIAGQKADMTSSEVQFGDHFVYDLVCLFFGFFTFFTFKSWVLRYVWKIM